MAKYKIAIQCIEVREDGTEEVVLTGTISTDSYGDLCLASQRALVALQDTIFEPLDIEGQIQQANQKL